MIIETLTIDPMDHFMHTGGCLKPPEAIMKRDDRTRYLMRHRILKLLSKGEIARVCTAESEIRIADGDEYLNLEAIGLGVRCSLEADAAAGRLLSRKAVRQATWSKILRVLAEPSLATPRSAAPDDRP